MGRLNKQNSTTLVSNIDARVALAVSSLEQKKQASSSLFDVSNIGIETKPSALAISSSTTLEKAAPSPIQNNSSSTVSTENGVPITFVIMFPQETRTVNFSAHTGDTVYDAMKTFARQNNCDIQFKEFTGLGAMVRSINGVANDPRANKFWIYYLNGALAKAGISSVKINSQDIIKWQYEAGKE